MIIESAHRRDNSEPAMHPEGPVPSILAQVHARTSPELRRRNRRVGLFIGLTVVILTALCALYIATLGGRNKPPMKPFHSHVPAPTATRTA